MVYSPFLFNTLANWREIYTYGMHKSAVSKENTKFMESYFSESKYLYHDHYTIGLLFSTEFALDWRLLGYSSFANIDILFCWKSDPCTFTRRTRVVGLLSWLFETVISMVEDSIRS